jgi:hypothetical protein
LLKRAGNSNNAGVQSYPVHSDLSEQIYNKNHAYFPDQKRTFPYKIIPGIHDFFLP